MSKLYFLLLIGLLSCMVLPAFAQTGTISGTVKDQESGEALAGATILVVGTTTGTTTDAQGRFTITVPAGKVSLQVSTIGFQTQTKEFEVAAGSAQTFDFSMPAGDRALDEITVVGSRNANRSVLETPVPVDVISVKELMNIVPQTDLNQMLTYLAPSYQSNRQTISDGTDHIDPASLRGLGPDQVLVLVNGKRRHNTALVNVNGTLGRGNVGTDLNTIPAAAIERIEVLRDGAAAQYGSDAIAGVVNIVLRKNVNDFSANYTTGIHGMGDGVLNQLNGNYGFSLGNKGGYLNITGDYTFRGYTNRMTAWFGSVYGTAYLNNPGLNPEGAANDDALLAARGLTRQDLRMRIGNSEVANAAAMFNMSIPISKDAEFYAFGGINYRNGLSAGFYRLPSQNTQVVYEIYPNGFLPEIHSFINDKSIGTGIKSKVNGWTIDFSNVYGFNRFRFRVENSLNASLGSASPLSFDSGGFSFAQNVTGLSATRLFDKVFQGLNVALGSEFRVDNYQIFAGQAESYTDYDGSAGRVGGAQVFPGFQPRNEVNRFRTNFAAYADIEVDLTKAFLVGIAGRFENYSDFGSTLNGKLALRYNIVEDIFAIRGAISTGFRAPALHQLYFNTVSTLFVGGTPFEVGTFSNDSQVAQILGIPNLKQETSVNYSLGITSQPIKNLNISVDGYFIKVDDRVVLTGQFQGTQPPAGTSQDQQIFALLSSVGANRAQFFTNAINTTTKGIDVIATYGFELGPGKLDLSLAANFNETTVDKINIAASLLQGKENIYFDRENRSVVETGVPRSKINLTATYKIGKFSAMVRTVRFGSIFYKHPSDELQTSWIVNEFTGEVASRDQEFTAKWVTDFSLTYQLLKNVNIQVGANNIFDVYPDRQQHFDNFSFGRFPYSRRVTQFGFNGVFYFTRLGIRL